MASGRNKPIPTIPIIMEKKEIIQKLSTLKENKALDEEQRLAITDAINILKKAKKWEQSIKAVEILVKLLGIGSKFYDP